MFNELKDCCKVSTIVFTKSLGNYYETTEFAYWRSIYYGGSMSA